MEKKLIYLEKRHIKRLEDQKKATGVNMSEIIRRLLDNHFEEEDGKQNGRKEVEPRGK